MSVHEQIEALGLRTYGKEREDPNHIPRRVILKYEPVIQLYKEELATLAERLQREQGEQAYYEDDPKLFDKELDTLLAEYGPKIWPRPELGSREHLRSPKKNTRYMSDLVYPRDSSILKQYLRKIVCRKCFNLGRTEKQRQKTAATPARRRRVRKSQKSKSTPPRKALTPDNDDDDDDTASGSDDSVMGTQTRRQATKRSAVDSRNESFQIELRLYRVSSGPAPVLPLGNVLLSGDCTADECFSRISEHSDSDCSWMVFQLPEDMSREAKVRVHRGTRASEVAFQRVIDLFRNSRMFRSESPRSVEVEIGLDLFSGA